MTGISENAQNNREKKTTARGIKEDRIGERGKAEIGGGDQKKERRKNRRGAVEGLRKHVNGQSDVEENL